MATIVIDNEKAINLLNKYKALLFKVSKEVKTKCPNLDFDDIYQILSIRLLKAAAKIDENKGKEITYIYESLIHEANNINKNYYRESNITIYHNLSLEAIKDKNNNIINCSDSMSLGECEDNYFNPKSNFEENEFIEKILKLKNELSKRDKIIFELLISGYNSKKISTKLNISLKCVYNRIRIIKNKIKEKL